VRDRATNQLSHAPVRDTLLYLLVITFSSSSKSSVNQNNRPVHPVRYCARSQLAVYLFREYHQFLFISPGARSWPFLPLPILFKILSLIEDSATLSSPTIEGGVGKIYYPSISVSVDLRIHHFPAESMQRQADAVFLSVSSFVVNGTNAGFISDRSANETPSLLTHSQAPRYHHADRAIEYACAYRIDRAR